jgi:hypothetical protein
MADSSGSDKFLPAVEAARRAGVPEPAITRLLAYGLDRRLRHPEMTRLLAIFIDIRKRQLPVAPFLQKVDEGLAKRIDPATLENALTSQRDNYVFLDTLLDRPGWKEGVRAPKDLSLLADSLDFGLSRTELTRLFEENTGASLSMMAVAAETKALLRQINLDPKLTDAIITEGLNANAFTGEWRKLSKIIAMAKSRGVPERRIATAVRNVLKGTGRLRDLLPKLGFMGRNLVHGPRQGALEE